MTLFTDKNTIFFFFQKQLFAFYLDLDRLRLFLTGLRLLLRRRRSLLLLDKIFCLFFLRCSIR